MRTISFVFTILIGSSFFISSSAQQRIETGNDFYQFGKPPLEREVFLGPFPDSIIEYTCKAVIIGHFVRGGSSGGVASDIMAVITLTGYEEEAVREALSEQASHFVASRKLIDSSSVSFRVYCDAREFQ